MDKIQKKAMKSSSLTGKDKGKRGIGVAPHVDAGACSSSKVSTAQRSTSSRTRSRVLRVALSIRTCQFNISNVALYNPATSKADRVGFKTLEDGRKVRVFKSNGELVSA
jgi:large subunit ribosomal protein L24